jgi:hypothetical protein
MATTQTTKRRTAATKRSTTAKKAAGTRARNSASANATRAKANAKRRVSAPSTAKAARPVLAQADMVRAAAGNIVQTGVTAGSKVAASVTRRVANFL